LWPGLSGWTGSSTVARIINKLTVVTVTRIIHKETRTRTDIHMIRNTHTNTHTHSHTRGRRRVTCWGPRQQQVQAQGHTHTHTHTHERGCAFSFVLGRTCAYFPTWIRKNFCIAIRAFLALLIVWFTLVFSVNFDLDLRSPSAEPHNLVQLPLRPAIL
jgi:hypothetical protein